MSDTPEELKIDAVIVLSMDRHNTAMTITYSSMKRNQAKDKKSN